MNRLVFSGGIIFFKTPVGVVNENTIKSKMCPGSLLHIRSKERRKRCPGKDDGGPSQLLFRWCTAISSSWEEYLVYCSGIDSSSNNDANVGVPELTFKAFDRPTVVSDRVVRRLVPFTVAQNRHAKINNLSTTRTYADVVSCNTNVAWHGRFSQFISCKWCHKKCSGISFNVMFIVAFPGIKEKNV